MSDRYRVTLHRRAEKDIDALKQHRAAAVRELLKLEENPILGHVLAGSLRGARSLEFTLKGSGAYRAVYVVDDVDRVCVVFIVGSHENIYKRAERRWESIKREIGL